MRHFNDLLYRNRLKDHRYLGKQRYEWIGEVQLDEEEVMKIIALQKNHKATGFDGILAEFLNNCGQICKLATM